MKAKKGLQKFTKTETKINQILSLEQITPKDIEPLSEKESTRLMEILTERFNELQAIRLKTNFGSITIIK